MRTLSGSPSSGEYEALRALFLARGHDGNYVAPTRCRRYLPHRIATSEISSLLAGESSTFVQTDGSGNYRLTAAGVSRSRANRPRRWVTVP